MSSSMWRFTVAACAAVATSAAGCTEETGTLVYVTVEARPAVSRAATIDVTLANDSATLAESFDVADRSFPLTFTITAEGRTGALDIDIVALDEDGIEVALGAGAATLVADERTDASVLLEPSDFVVNTTIAGAQRLGFSLNTNARQLAARPDGSFVVAWTNDCSMAGRCDEFGRLFDAEARPVRNDVSMSTDEFLVNQSEVFGQDPAVAAGEDATLICWFSFEDLWCSGFDADGAHLDFFDILVTSAIGVADPAVAALADGTFVVVWTEANADETGRVVLGQLIGADGQPAVNPITDDAGIFPISTDDAGDAITPAVAVADGDGYAVVWLDGNDIYLRFFDEDGFPRPSEQVLAVNTVDNFADVWGPQVAWHDGAARIAWGIQIFDTPPFEQGQVRMKSLAPPIGTPIGTEVVLAETAQDIFSAAALAVRADGTTGLAWHDCTAAGDGAGCGIVARLFRPTGLAIDQAPQIVNTTTVDDQVSPSLVAGADGAWIAAWTDESQVAPDTDEASIRARVFYPDDDPADGRQGARCGGGGDAPCDDGLGCLPGSDGEPYCHVECDPEAAPPQCPGGGVCSTSGGVSACVL